MRSDGPVRVPWILRSALGLGLSLAVALGLPLAVLVSLIIAETRSMLQAEAEAENRVTAHVAAEAVRSHFDGLADYMDSFATRSLLRESAARKSAADIERHLKEIVTFNPSFSRAMITDPSGVLWHGWPEDPKVVGRSFAFRDWYQGVVSRQGVYVSAVYLRAAEPRVLVVAVASPVRDAAGRVIAYLVGHHSLEALQDRFEVIRPSPAGGVTLVDQHGQIANAHAIGSTEPAKITDAGGGRGPDPRTGLDSLRSSARVQEFGWMVVASQPVEEVFAPAQGLTWAVAGLSLVSLAGMIGLGFIWLNSLRRHHLALADLQVTKEMLSGMVVHDMRNPLTAVMGWIELLQQQEQGVSAEARQDLGNAREAALRLLEMVNTLLDVTRMEDGKIPYSPVRQDLRKLISDKVEQYRGAAVASKLALSARVPEGEVAATLDPTLIGRVVENLMTNAIKHTPGGGSVEVETAVEADGSRTIRVRDTGEGIPREYIPKLFQKYGRVEMQKLGYKYDTGLGLVFCRMAVELHGGTISVESEVGKGSAVTVRLPLDARPRPK